MGGVDFLDQLMSYYRVFIKSKKWTLRVIFHFVDVAVCASWLEYKKDCELYKIQAKDVMHLLEFKQVLGRCLTIVPQLQNRKRGRPLNISEVMQPTTSRFVRGEVRPLQELQYDRMEHLPYHDVSQEATRCKNPKCTGRSRIYCNKCKVHLCLTKDRNCFVIFHTK